MATKIKVGEILDAIRGEGRWVNPDPNKSSSSQGNVTVVAKRLGIARKTVYVYKNKFSTVADALHEEKETTKDFVEGKIMQHIISGSVTMAIFYAKTQMKDRGYVERQEVETRDVEDFTPAVYLPERGSFEDEENTENED